MKTLSVAALVLLSAQTLQVSTPCHFCIAVVTFSRLSFLLLLSTVCVYLCWGHTRPVVSHWERRTSVGRTNSSRHVLADFSTTLFFSNQSSQLSTFSMALKVMSHRSVVVWVPSSDSSELTLTCIHSLASLFLSLSCRCIANPLTDVASYIWEKNGDDLSVPFQYVVSNHNVCSDYALHVLLQVLYYHFTGD